jgi:flavin-dependent dehydrogenase
MRIGVIGARLSGSYAALLLRQLGHEVFLFDPAVEKEKPCGGGLTAKALRTMAWLSNHSLPHARISAVQMSTHAGPRATLSLRSPLHIFSRYALDSSLREDAIAAGVRFLPERALRFSRQERSWEIVTSRSSYEVDFLIGADGSVSPVRALVASKYGAADLSLALGFYLPGARHTDRVITAFQESGFQGYIWSFPRVDHTAVGILRHLPQANSSDLRRRVQDFISTQYPDAGPERSFYAALIPCLSAQTLTKQRVCGSDWALLGDAAGFADAITAEGIYFALRSAELLARSFQEGEPLAYENAWRRDFGADLKKAAEWRDRFYGGTFLFRAFLCRAVQMTGRSETVQRLTDSLIAGTCAYAALRRQLILKSPRILIETIIGSNGSIPREGDLSYNR